MDGIVFNIQRFSIHDGPGIRTTVFLKGCPLHCFWCHNPEGIHRQTELQIFPDLCINCGECFQVCPLQAHVMANGSRRFERAICQACGRCADNCFSKALVLVGQKMTVAEVMEEVLRDLPFYTRSGGGITLSGGEPLKQLEFSRATLMACKKQGIHTAIETAGHTRWPAMAGLLPLLDLVMMDLKHMDSEKHRRSTGVANEQILENARRLAETDKPLIFRTPVIPRVNDTPVEIEAIARFVQSLVEHRAELFKDRQDPSPISLELLPFHPLGGDKYGSLDMKNRAADLKPLTKERHIELQNIVENTLPNQ